MNILTHHPVRKNKTRRLVAHRANSSLFVDGIAFTSVGEAANKAIYRLRATFHQEGH